MKTRILCLTGLFFSGVSFFSGGCSSVPKGNDPQTSRNLINHIVLPVTGPIQAHRFDYKNGLRLIVIEDHSSPTFAYQTWYQVGSRNEVPGRTGLAHLFEHMMFKETKNLKDGEFDHVLEEAGVQNGNAFTSQDYTAYIQELPKSKLELITRLEAERAHNLIVNDKAFHTEREVVQNERRFRNENNPDGIMEQTLFELAFQKHPYHWPVIGYQSDLDAMTTKDALKFYQTYYSPNHATILVAGDVDAEEVSSLVNTYYGDLPAVSSPESSHGKLSHPISAEPKQISPRSKKLRLNIQVQKLLMGYHIPEVLHPDTPTLAVIQGLLTSGNSSRLNRAMVNTGVATRIDSESSTSKDPSLFLIFADLQSGKSAKEAESIILNELKKLQTDKVSDLELDRVKNKIDFTFYQGFESNFMKAYFLGYHQTVAGDFNFGLDLHQRIKNVTAEDIQQVARKYFQPHARTVIEGVQK